jgi:hypothetical protein
MSVPFIAERFRFEGTFDYLYDECYPRKISFKTEYGLAAAKNNEEKYEEFTIMCHVKKNADFAFYYLSRAYVSHSVFVYRTDDTGAMFPQLLVSNVREVFDEIATRKRDSLPANV